MSFITGSFWEKIKAPWLQTADRNRIDYGFQPDYSSQWKNPTAGGPNLYGVGVSPAGSLTFGGPGALAVQPVLVPAIYTLEPTAAILDQNFYVANQAMKVVSISEIHRVAGNDAGAVTAVIRKCSPGQSVSQGTAIMTNTFNMKGTAQTQQNGTLAGVPSITLAAGDRLVIDYTGTLTTLAGVFAQVMLQPLVSPTLDVTFTWNANAGLVDAQFFVANAPYTVTAVRYSHATKGTDAGAVNALLFKDTGTNAPGAGTALITNNTNAGFDCKAAIDMPQLGTLTATAASLALAVGDRLTADFDGTTTALAGVTMTVSLTPLAGVLEIPFYIPGAPAANTDQTFFIADRNYIVFASSELHAVAAGGASTSGITKESGTTAPGGGTDLLVAASDLNGVAQTVVVDLLSTVLGVRRLKAGDRLSWDPENAVQATSGLLYTLQLLAA